MDKKFLQELLLPFHKDIEKRFSEFFNENMNDHEVQYKNDALRGMLGVLSYMLGKLLAHTNMSTDTDEVKLKAYQNLVDCIEIARKYAIKKMMEEEDE